MIDDSHLILLLLLIQIGAVVRHCHYHQSIQFWI